MIIAFCSKRPLIMSNLCKVFKKTFSINITNNFNCRYISIADLSDKNEADLHSHHFGI